MLILPSQCLERVLHHIHKQGSSHNLNRVINQSAGSVAQHTSTELNVVHPANTATCGARCGGVRTGREPGQRNCRCGSGTPADTGRRYRAQYLPHRAFKSYKVLCACTTGWAVQICAAITDGIPELYSYYM